MTDLRQAAQQAREALIDAANVLSAPMFADAVTALTTALAQPEQEPVAREGFEKWAKSLPNYMDISRFETGYSDCNTDYAWVGWQAALAQPQQQAEPPPEWPLVKNILDEYGLDAISFVAEWQAAQRPWQGLTPEEVKHLYPYGRSIWGKETFEAIEKALKEKNT